LKFFFDNNLAPKLAHGLNQMVEPDHHVVHLKDKFAADTEDAVWMQGLAHEHDLVIVTADVRIRRNHTKWKPGRKLATPFSS
jgi:predicted nuclease of predicted toxin-antitoxin system